MENAVDALMIAFGVLVFVIAIGSAFTVFSQAQDTADLIVYSMDKTNYEEYVPELAKTDRVVGIETIIPIIRRYVTENEGYSVIVIDGSNKYEFSLEADRESGMADTQILRELDKSLETLYKKYKGNKGVTFSESFKIIKYRGEVVEALDGETYEAINTDFKTVITYTRN